MSRTGAALVLVFAAGGCDGLNVVPPPPQEVIVRVMSDPDTPLAGAEMVLREGPPIRTDEAGVARLTLTGRDGDAFDVFVKCPEGFLSPAKPVQVRLRRLVDRTSRPEYAVSCPPEKRTAVIAVRANMGAGLPLMYLGREVARTDASGAALALLSVKPHEKIVLQLVTKKEKCEEIFPEVANLERDIEDRDDLFLFDVAFRKKLLPCIKIRVSRPTPKRIQ